MVQSKSISIQSGTWLNIRRDEKRLRRLVAHRQGRDVQRARWQDFMSQVHRKWDQDRMADLIKQITRRPLWSLVENKVRSGACVLTCGPHIKLTFQAVRRPVFRPCGSRLRTHPCCGYEVYGKLLMEGRFFEWNRSTWEIVEFLWSCERRARELAAEDRAKKRKKKSPCRG